MEPIHGDKLRGHLETMVLSTLESGAAHGLEILKRLEEAGCGLLQLKEGSLYPALYRLESAGEVKAVWEAESHGRRGARRRIYTLTSKGQAQAQRRSWRMARIRARCRWHSGGTSMNESTLIQLKILVERAVRPVRASIARKQTMREELLAHVSSVFEEELTRQADTQAALAQTERRFGNPAEVTRNLQASLPRLDRIDLVVDELWLRPGEPTWRRAIRHTLVGETWLALFVGLIVSIITAQWVQAGMRPGEWPGVSFLNFGAWAAIACAIQVGGGTVLAERIRLLLNSRSRPSLPSTLLLLFGGTALIATIATIGIAMGVVDNFWVQLNTVVWLFAFGLATTGILVCIALANSRRILEAEEWASLPIEA